MRYLLLSLAVLALVATLWTSATQVDSGERGVVRRLGRVIDVAGPGLHIGLPWGIDRVERVNVDFVQRVTVGYSERDGDEVGLSTPPGQLVTGDHNLVNIQVLIDYTVKDTEVQQFVLYGSAVDGLVARTTEGVLAEWVAGRTVDEVLLSGKLVLPAHLVAEVQKRIGFYELGVQIKTANIPLLSAPREVKPAFDEVNRAQAEIQTKLHEAEQESDGLWRKALSEKFTLEQNAKARAVAIVELAKALAAGFRKNVEVYHQLRQTNPNYLATLWWDEMSRLYARLRETGRIDLLDHWLAGDGFDILQMPLMPKKN